MENLALILVALACPAGLGPAMLMEEQRDSKDGSSTSRVETAR